MTLPFCILALIAGVWSPGSGPVAPVVWPGGGFISFVNDAVPGDSSDGHRVDWSRTLSSMHDIGLDTVIITRTLYDDAQGREWSFFREPSIDPTEQILRCADSLGMSVFIGLWEDVRFDNEHLTETYLRFATDRTLSLVQEVWQRYHARHPSFVGWYIPLESWNIGAGSEEVLQRKIQMLNRFYRSIAEGCRGRVPLRDAALMKIAASVYFNPQKDPTWLAGPHDVPEIFSAILNRTGIDILLVQDGAGSHRPLRDPVRTDHYDDLVRQYFSAFARACRRSTPAVQVWALVEIFRYDSSQGEYAAASYGRLLQQVRLIHSVLPEAPCMLFDYYHFMNPVPTGEAVGTVAERRRSLYELYRSAYSLDR
jgi:Domain of unknown function (DUF4434)